MDWLSEIQLTSNNHIQNDGQIFGFLKRTNLWHLQLTLQPKNILYWNENCKQIVNNAYSIHQRFYESFVEILNNIVDMKLDFKKKHTSRCLVKFSEHTETCACRTWNFVTLSEQQHITTNSIETLGLQRCYDTRCQIQNTQLYQTKISLNKQVDFTALDPKFHCKLSLLALFTTTTQNKDSLLQAMTQH